MDPHGYRIWERIGQTDRADLYRAEHEAVGMLALRVWREGKPPDEFDNDAYRARASVAMRLEHGSLAKVFDHGYLLKFLPYVAEELVRGQAVHAPSLDVLIDVVATVGAIHAAGIFHGNLRPTKVLATGHPMSSQGPYRSPARAAVKLVGLLGPPSLRIKNRTGPGPLPRPIELHYLAPEQIRGGSSDARTDVYALGTLMYEGICGGVPYPERRSADGSARPMMEYLAYRLTEEPVPPRSVALAHNRDCPPVLADILIKATQKDPARRFADANELLVALREAAQRLP
jgi:eukaryotic-like serine/threonine-protein kinase